VAQRGGQVRVVPGAIAGYAARLPIDRPPADGGREVEPAGAPREELIAFWTTLDAVNFGSGWFPTLRKRAGRSGYFTVALGLCERFERSGPWSAAELSGITAARVAETLSQDPAHELMGLFAESLRDLGRQVADEHDGRFSALADSAGGSAAQLVDHLSRWTCFDDRSTYQEIELPFLKRGQILAADLHRGGLTTFSDLDRLTMFADNLVPHVLRLDGVLEFHPGLVERIERGELIEHGSPEEVEIRACAVHAVELLARARPERCAAQIDQLLWRRGQSTRYKARPRHRSRCTAY
jgi:hypothetical protein